MLLNLYDVVELKQKDFSMKLITLFLTLFFTTSSYASDCSDAFSKKQAQKKPTSAVDLIFPKSTQKEKEATVEKAELPPPATLEKSTILTKYKEIQALTTEQIQDIPPEQVKELVHLMTKEQLKALIGKQLQAISEEQMMKLGDKVDYFTLDQRKLLPAWITKKDIKTLHRANDLDLKEILSVKDIKTLHRANDLKDILSLD